MNDGLAVPLRHNLIPHHPSQPAYSLLTINYARYTESCVSYSASTGTGMDQPFRCALRC